MPSLRGLFLVLPGEENLYIFQKNFVGCYENSDFAGKAEFTIDAIKALDPTAIAIGTPMNKVTTKTKNTAAVIVIAPYFLLLSLQYLCSYTKGRIFESNAQSQSKIRLIKTRKRST